MNKIIIYTLLILAVSTWACKEKSNTDATENNTEASEAVEVSENQILYNEVMKIHDEAMAKLDDVERQKETLRNKIIAEPAIADEKRKALEVKIARLDSANESMMVWMRNFNPLPDSTGEEKAREYLENEMEKVKSVRENILQTLKDSEKD